MLRQGVASIREGEETRVDGWNALGAQIFLDISVQAIIGFGIMSNKIPKEVTEAARLLSWRGAAMGGRARAKKLSKSRRSEIARMGGNAGGRGRPKIVLD